MTSGNTQPKERSSMKVTVTIDLDRLEEFGGGDEAVAEFLKRAVASKLSGGRGIVWSYTVANVGTVDAIETLTVGQAAARKAAADKATTDALIADGRKRGLIA
jgi:hypothetical protein